MNKGILRYKNEDMCFEEKVLSFEMIYKQQEDKRALDRVKGFRMGEWIFWWSRQTNVCDCVRVYFGKEHETVTHRKARWKRRIVESPSCSLVFDNREWYKESVHLESEVHKWYEVS